MKKWGEEKRGHRGKGSEGDEGERGITCREKKEKS